MIPDPLYENNYITNQQQPATYALNLSPVYHCESYLQRYHQDKYCLERYYLDSTLIKDRGIQVHCAIQIGAIKIGASQIGALQNYVVLQSSVNFRSNCYEIISFYHSTVAISGSVYKERNIHSYPTNPCYNYIFNQCFSVL